MSNYPNMSYCMNSNTLLALRQIITAMTHEGAGFIADLSKDERHAFNELFNACEDFLTLSEELTEEYESEYGDSMDGDHESALASAGWGTDEDYGYHGDE